jgi:hypothetical protein
LIFWPASLDSEKSDRLHSEKSLSRILCMKLALLTFLFIVGVTATAQARLGETPDQLVARYGQPLSVDDQKAQGDKVAASKVAFQKGGFEIDVTLSNGVSAAESFKKLNNEPFTLDEIQYLLNVNQQGHAWEAPDKVEGEKIWGRDDAAAAKLSQDGTIFVVKSKELMNDQSLAKKLEHHPSLDGF